MTHSIDISNNERHKGQIIIYGRGGSEDPSGHLIFYIRGSVKKIQCVGGGGGGGKHNISGYMGEERLSDDWQPRVCISKAFSEGLITLDDHDKLY